MLPKVFTDWFTATTTTKLVEQPPSHLLLHHHNRPPVVIDHDNCIVLIELPHSDLHDATSMTYNYDTEGDNADTMIELDSTLEEVLEEAAMFIRENIAKCWYLESWSSKKNLFSNNGEECGFNFHDFNFYPSLDSPVALWLVVVSIAHNLCSRNCQNQIFAHAISYKTTGDKIGSVTVTITWTLMMHPT